MKWLFSNLASSICVTGAVIILVQGGDTGWGWLLFVALLLA